MIDLRQSALVALFRQDRLKLRHTVEVILQRILVTSGDHQHVGEARRHGLLHDVLDGRFVHDGQHFLRHGLGGRKEASAQSGGGNDGFGDRSTHGTHHIGI